jgi:hypothetical protein
MALEFEIFAQLVSGSHVLMEWSVVFIWMSPILIGTT